MSRLFAFFERSAIGLPLNFAIARTLFRSFGERGGPLRFELSSPMYLRCLLPIEGESGGALMCGLRKPAVLLYGDKPIGSNRFFILPKFKLHRTCLFGTGAEVSPASSTGFST